MMFTYKNTQGITRV